MHKVVAYDGSGDGLVFVDLFGVDDGVVFVFGGVVDGEHVCLCLF